MKTNLIKTATLVLFLVDGLPSDEERYVYYWLPERDLLPYKMSGVTTNIENYKEKIADLIDNEGNEYVNTTKFIEKVGKYINEHLGLRLLFETLYDLEISEFVILTNEVKIPWEWLYNNDSKKFLCERFSLGKVFVTDTQKYPKKGFQNNENRKIGFDSKNPEKNKIIIFFDKGGGEKYHLDKIEKVEEEVTGLQEIFNSTITPSNLRIIDGSLKNAEQDFFEYIFENLEQIRIIHYAGHVKDNALVFQTNKICCNELTDKLLRHKLNSPLIFINGCNSGKIDDVWESEKNISTAFLDIGASNVICTNRDICDNPSKDFANLFYRNLLSKQNSSTSIGEILKSTRLDYKRKFGYTNNHWLLYTLYGHPYIKFFSQPDPDMLYKKAVPPETEDAIKSLS